MFSHAVIHCAEFRCLMPLLCISLITISSVFWLTFCSRDMNLLFKLLDSFSICLHWTVSFLSLECFLGVNHCDRGISSIKDHLFKKLQIFRQQYKYPAWRLGSQEVTHREQSGKLEHSQQYNKTTWHRGKRKHSLYTHKVEWDRRHRGNTLGQVTQLHRQEPWQEDKNDTRLQNKRMWELGLN